MYKDLIIITNRTLCRGDYLKRLAYLTGLDINSVILREKDITKAEYFNLAEAVLSICKRNNKELYIHSFYDIARQLNCMNLHISIEGLRNIKSDISDFDNISVACHSREDVEAAKALGATRIVLGTIFETECKKGLKGKGLSFVKEICEISTVPVYVIGGITPDNISDCKKAGAAGGCMMSGFMQADLPV